MQMAGGWLNRLLAGTEQGRTLKTFQDWPGPAPTSTYKYKYRHKIYKNENKYRHRIYKYENKYRYKLYYRTILDAAINYKLLPFDGHSISQLPKDTGVYVPASL